MLRRAAQAGFTPDEVAAAAYAAASRAQAARRAGPRPVRRMHHRGRRLRRRAAEPRVPRRDRGRGHAPRRAARAARPVPLRPRRDDHVPRRRGPGAGGRPGAGRGDARRAGLRRARPRDRRAARAPASGVVCASDRGTENIAETLSIAGTKGVEIVSATIDDDERLALVDRTADLILMSREALAQGLDKRLAPTRADPAVDLRVRSGGPRAPAPRDRARSPPRARRLPRTEPAAGLTSFARCGRSPWRARRDDGTGSRPIVGRDGTLDAADAGARALLADRRASDRAPRTATAGQTGESAAGEVAALAALDAVLHRLIEPSATRVGRTSRGGDRGVRDRARGRGPRRGRPGMARPVPRTADERDAGARPAPTGAGTPGRGARARRAQRGSGGDGVRELVDDRPLRERTPYEAVARCERESAAGRAEARRGRRAPAAPEAARRRRAARARRRPRRTCPCRHGCASRCSGRPGSLAAQLRWVREHWRRLSRATALARRIDLALDVLAEEARAMELRTAGAHFGGPLDGRDARLPRPRCRAVAFSADTEWMPRVVLMAKSTYVWLEQLAARIRRGRWRPSSRCPTRRSTASPAGRHRALADRAVAAELRVGGDQARRGDADAVASAYAIDDYRIADDLGGEAAFANQRARLGAWHPPRCRHGPEPHGHRLELGHQAPEALPLLPGVPYPAYSFSGPDLSTGPARGDHPRGSLLGQHGRGGRVPPPGSRDGRDSASSTTAMMAPRLPWNDTAQLDYLQADVREAVIRTVSRRPPIADHPLRRRDGPRAPPHPAALVPGARAPAGRSRRAPSTRCRTRSSTGGCRRSSGARSSIGSPEAPGTLLLAEAFWLLEGYFVRTLGMPASTTRRSCTCSATRTTPATARSSRDTLEFDPGGARAIRELPDQPGRAAGGRAARNGRQGRSRRRRCSRRCRACRCSDTARSKVAGAATGRSSGARAGTNRSMGPQSRSFRTDHRAAPPAPARHSRHGAIPSL